MTAVTITVMATISVDRRRSAAKEAAQIDLIRHVRSLIGSGHPSLKILRGIVLDAQPVAPWANPA